MPAVDLWISTDVEADGAIPGPFSMSSFGMSACGLDDGSRVTRLDGTKDTFYRELKPISDRFDPQAAAVAGLDRDYLIAHGADPATAMAENAAWITEVAARYDARPVFVAYPLGYDWLWHYWYAVNFTGQSPFGHSGHWDMKSIYGTKARVRLGKAVKARMPKHLLSGRRHTHNALDDAIEQGEMMVNLAEWDGR